MNPGTLITRLQISLQSLNGTGSLIRLSGLASTQILPTVMKFCPMNRVVLTLFLILNVTSSSKLANQITAVFTDHEVEQCGKIRIPELAQTPSRILLFAQCREANQSHYPTAGSGHESIGDDMIHAKVISKASSDNGLTWVNFTVHTPISYSHAAPIYDRVARQVVLQYQHHPSVNPEFNSTYYQRISKDDGLTWSAERNITGFLAVCNPYRPIEMEVESAGSKIQTSSGRLIFTGHSKHNDSAVWYSDDHGQTYTCAKRFSGNEVSVAELAPGYLYMNGRAGDHAWSPNRTQYTSHDDGSSWTAPSASQLIDISCEAALISVNNRSGANAKELNVLFFSEPTGQHRTDLTLRCSVDGGNTWPGVLKVNGHNSAAYSAMVFLETGYNGEPGILVVWETNNTMISTEVKLNWCFDEIYPIKKK